MTKRRAILIAAGALACAAAAWGLVAALKPGQPETYTYRPIGVMGTETVVTVTVEPDGLSRAKRAMRAAEAALRDVEARMSTWIDSTEISLLNAAPAGKVVKLSAPSLAVLRLSRDLARQTDGAFDVTCRPVLQVWKRAGKAKRLPTEAELAEARRHAGWDKLTLAADGASKTSPGAAVDLGGIAKGYAIDRAVEAMQAHKPLGGIVDVGGDVRCFGRRAGGGKWRVGVRDPFDVQSMFVTLAVDEAAVCTSGNYFRFVEIAGKRHSHIVDPRSGLSADAAPSVTVVARSAALADAWATALSVLGPAGLRRLPKGGGIEAMIVTGKPGEVTVHMTRGFGPLLVGDVGWKPVLHDPAGASATRPAAAEAGR